MFDLPPLAVGIRTLITPESDRLDKTYPDLAKDPLDCLTCRKHESFVWWSYYVEGADPENPEPVEYRCPCVDQWILSRFLLYHGVELAYQRLGWNDLTGVEPDALKLVRDEYLPNLDRYASAGIGLILHGGIGTGKSLLASIIAKEALAAGQDAHYTTFSGMLSALTAGWTDTEERTWFARRIRNAGLLVLDDIGREHKQRRYVKGEGLMDNTTALSESSVDELLRHRVAAAKPTIVTTNLDLDDLESSYGSNVMSLFRESSATYRFTGQDFRAQARARKLDEVNAGLTRPVVIS